MNNSKLLISIFFEELILLYYSINKSSDCVLSNVCNKNILKTINYLFYLFNVHL